MHVSSFKPFISQFLIDFQISSWQIFIKTSESNCESCRLQQCFTSKYGNEVKWTVKEKQYNTVVNTV